MDNKLHYKFIKSKFVRPRKQVDGYALFHTENARFFVTNDIGYQVWNECDGTKTVEEIIINIVNSFNEKPEYTQVETDVLEILADFQKYELVS